MSNARPGTTNSAGEGAGMTDSPGKAFIKACSEAIFMGVAHCISQKTLVASSIRQNLHPVDQMTRNLEHTTKLMVNLLSGGKPVNSGVKFANFYLLIDGNLNAEINVAQAFKSFLAQMRSKFTTGKGGDSAFKCLPDGSYFNAYPSITDSFKFIEEAV